MALMSGATTLPFWQDDRGQKKQKENGEDGNANRFHGCCLRVGCVLERAFDRRDYSRNNGDNNGSFRRLYSSNDFATHS